MIRKSLIALLGVAAAVVFTPVQAASPMGPGSQPGTENLTYTVKAKAKKAKVKKAKAKKGKKVASKGPGRCGTGKYWNRKTRACASKV